MAVIERYYTAFNQGDVEGVIALLTDDVIHDINQGGREVGKDAFRAFLQRMNRHYREQIADLVVFINRDGTRAAAEFTVSGTYLVAEDGMPEAHGQTYRLPVGAFFELRGRRIARVTNYYNVRDWIAQVS